MKKQTDLSKELDLEAHFDFYVSGMDLKGKMSESQADVIKTAFFAGMMQLFEVMTHGIPEMNEKDAHKALDKLKEQLTGYFIEKVFGSGVRDIFNKLESLKDE